MTARPEHSAVLPMGSTCVRTMQQMPMKYPLAMLGPIKGLHAFSPILPESSHVLDCLIRSCVVLQPLGSVLRCATSLRVAGSDFT